MVEPKRSQNLLVLTKITAILDAFTLSAPELTLVQIRERTGLPASTAQRLVANLVDQGFLDRTTVGYRVGLRMTHWAAPALQGLDAIDVTRPILGQMRDEIGETVALFRESHGFRVCVAMAETRHVLRRAMRVGQVLPLHAGSAGRVILAWTPGLLDRILADGVKPLTEGTIVDERELRAVVRRTYEDGYAVTSGERQTGAGGLAAPVFTAQGELYGALAVMGPNSRLPAEECERWVPYLVEKAELVTRALGGRHPDED